MGDGGTADYNTLSVNPGGTLSHFGTCYLGTWRDFNSILVASNATLHGGQLTVGYGGESKALNVANGGAFTCATFRMGEHATGADNTALVAGAATTFSVTDTANIGYAGNSNVLEIVGVPTPTFKDVNIGEGSYGDGDANRMVVSGGDELRVTGNLVVGRNGRDNC
ncbi:MAG: hypothetical protein FWF84_04500, partial [Kiritimatiellaeota bacterium]|nr:hypothetical protein [Kiritimatiellota bacterium]